MSEDGDDYDMALLERFKDRRRSAVQSLAGRRERETRTVAPADRHRLMHGASVKNTQLNIQVRQEFKARVLALAKSEGISQPVLIERAVELYAQSKTK